MTSVIAATVLLAVLALPAVAAGQTKLSRPSVAPSSGTTATTFVLKVTYRNRDGEAPGYVRVVIGGRAYAMAPSGTDWKEGVEFSVRTKLAAGDYKVLFTTGGDGSGNDQIAGQMIHVGRPAALGGTPEPSTDGGTSPTPKPPADTTTRPSSAPESTPAAAAPAASPAPTWAAGPYGPVSAGTGPGPAAPDDPARPGGPAGGETTAGLPGSWGDLTRFLDALGLDPADSPLFRLVPVMIWTTGGVGLAMAFGFFGKRRRDGEPPEPDEVLSADAARGTGEAPTAALVPESDAPKPPVDAEMAMPRWRRPSLLEARKADPLRSGAVAPRLTFDDGAVSPVEGVERRVIRYLVVHLLDMPDEFRGTAIGTVAQGDEVQLLERSGTYWLVLCPDGQEGWIHRMTLGDVVGAQPAPSARETWATASVEIEDVDDDVLAAFMTARGRA
ncbi:MAG TPA: hypothetical protein VGQ58_03670 [Candidatus Limnocylindrales bacterium]|nr:hypothetical protein [Candidatus Limnocylindrales bacterium]